LRACRRGAFKILLTSGPPQLSTTARPETFPLWDTYEPYATPSCGVCPTPGAERGAALRLAPGRVDRAVGAAWPPAGGAGGLQRARSRGARAKMPFVFSAPFKFQLTVC